MGRAFEFRKARKLKRWGNMSRTFTRIGKEIIMVAFLCLSCISCSQSLSEVDNFDKCNINSNSEQINVEVHDGYLSFPTYKTFENFLMHIQEYGESPYTDSRCASFESIAMLEKRMTEQSRAIDDLALPENDLDELEEMTKDEYNLMKAESLIFDNLLFHALDTTLRICVEGNLYKITKDGTFSVKLELAKKLDEAVSDFDPTIKDSCDAGETIQLDSDVRFTNSFKDVSEQYGDLLEYQDDSPITRAPVPATTSQNEFHKNYNVDSYKWKNTNLFKSILDLIRGKDVSKAKNFSKNYRVQVNIFDVNYAYYKSAGIKVKMQKRKKFCGIPYWKEIEADKLVIGFNEMEGELKYNVPNDMATISPSASDNWKKFQATFDGMVASCLYGTYHNLKFIKDWTDDAVGWMPELKIGNNNYTENIINKIYNMPADVIYKQTKQLINKTVYKPIERQIKPTDPTVAYLIWGVTSTQFDKEHPYITGVKEYKSLKSKSVIFDRSFGVAFYSFVPLPYTPSDFDIKSIDAFGGAYYDNKWLGVRFYGM